MLPEFHRFIAPGYISILGQLPMPIHTEIEVASDYDKDTIVIYLRSNALIKVEHVKRNTILDDSNYCIDQVLAAGWDFIYTAEQFKDV